MATIDLIVLGILKKEPMGAYDIQKLVEYRNISKWVKISTPSIYKKAIQLEEKGFIKGEIVKEGKMPEKAVYSLTDEGEKEFVKLMMETASKPIHFFLDFNAVIVNLDKLPPESQQSCIASIEENIEILNRKSFIDHGDIEVRMKESEQNYYKTCINIEVHFQEQESGLIQEYFPDCQIEKMMNGVCRTFIGVPAKERLWKALLLSFGDRVKVVAPEEYKKELIDTARNFLSNYDS